MKSLIRKAICLGVFAGVLAGGASLPAQTPASKPTLMPAPRTDVALTFTADYANPVGQSSQWLKGGSIEWGTNLWHGLGMTARVSGVTTGSLGNQAVPLSLVLTTFGPRYRWTLHPAARHNISFYGETLIGVANGFNGLFPTLGGTTDSANTFAMQTGGGVDYALSRHFAWRIADANWTRTQFQNAASNVQNQMQLGSGLAFRF